jgi:ribosomal protein S18 acetylase RimI-like enzyme
MSSSEVSLRPATPEDVEFACHVSRETMRGHALATFGAWNEEEARQRCSRNISAGFTQIIELEGVQIGIYVVERAPDHVQLLQIFILPDYQRRGIGSRLIERLLAEARAASLPLRLRVLRVNPAFELYRRMGFQVVQETPERYFMEHPL